MPQQTNYEKVLARRASYDPSALETLYELYLDRIYRYISSRISNSYDVDDLVSDTFVKVIKGIENLENRHDFSFSAWIFAIARNVVIDFYRKKGYYPNKVGLESLSKNPAPYLDPSVIIIETESYTELHTYLKRLPYRRQEVMRLKYFGGLRNKEIAKVLGIEERTVASHLSRGLKDLYEIYQKAYY